MSVSFSEEGPVFPKGLVNALRTGNVAFLCGAGVSAPQLPGFKKLVKECFKHLRMEMDPSEAESFCACRYEEVLGSLNRRIVNPANFTRTITKLLQPPENPDLSHHHTILRLSRNTENRPVIITTNFDTLLEQALLESGDKTALSFAGQDLPTPGSTDFGGIIHLHGRIASQTPKLDATSLVITSADYGDAYMRSGWASRFLFDLCRCKTIVLVGYSAGDAPVRYFLNVLDADRQRFPDLHPVYALTDVAAHGEPNHSWEVLGVKAVQYVRGTDQKEHAALWLGLEKLADLIENPREVRRDAAQEILAKPCSDANDREKEYVAWLFKGSFDLWPVAIKTINDAAWLDFFAENKVWTDKDATWIVARWTTDTPESKDRFEQAIKWRRRLGKPFAVEISRRLEEVRVLPDLWRRAWRLLSIREPDHTKQYNERYYRVLQTLKGPVVLNADLEDAVEFLTPVLELTEKWIGFGSAPDCPKKLSDLTSPRMLLRNRDQGELLIKALVATPHAKNIMLIATARLQSFIAMSMDIENIQNDYDINDFVVPSVEPHPQNEHCDGPIFLIQLLARLLPTAAESDCSATRGLTEIWRTMPGNLGTRLWLHALRNTSLFTANEAISSLKALPKKNFWRLHREFLLALQDRAADADTELVKNVEQRILTEGDDFYRQYSIKENQADWRPHARDKAVWLRLNMIGADRLSEAGVAELAAIKTRHAYLDRDVRDQDFFDSYSTGVEPVVSDAKAIEEAPAQDRLKLLHDAIQNEDMEKRLGWNEYCRTDPNGAFDVLKKASFDEVNAELWRGLIEVLCFLKDEHDLIRNTLVDRLFKALEPAPDAFLTFIIGPLVILYGKALRQEKPEISAWWPRLFDIAVSQDGIFYEPSKDIIALAYKSPAGSLTHTTLIDIKQCQKAKEPVRQELLDAVFRAASAKGQSGLLACAILVRCLDSVLDVEEQKISELLDEALSGETAEAIALRSVLTTHTKLTLPVSQLFGAHFLRGITEISSKKVSETNAARNIVRIGLSIICKERDEKDWNITLDDVAKALRNGPPMLRKGVLKEWRAEIKEEPAKAWRTSIAPFLDSVWPHERALCHAELTPDFVAMAIKAEDAFPEALEWVLPYLGKWNDAASLLKDTDIPEKFPRETLTLLWKLCGVEGNDDLSDVSGILDRLIKVQPRIESDRRLQSLNQRSIRYQ